MNSLLLILVSIVLFIIAYLTYGSWLGKQWGVDERIPTPAHTMMDGIDYVPTKPQILLGHHFASIAGAGPITGPIQAAIFGWLPVVLWIIVGGIFFGGVHDYGALVASMKHKGKSIGSIIEENMGKTGKNLFSIFAWLTLVLVVAAFTNIVAETFHRIPQAATASVLMMFLAMGFSYFVYRQGVHLGIATFFGVLGVVGCIFLGTKFPLSLSENTWIAIIAVYVLAASILPVWILLQPRDYLNSFLLYAMIAGAVIGVAVYRPVIRMDAFTGFVMETEAGTQWLFPILFITVACGSISGFHALVGSGTTSKQIANERHAKLIGYGGMLTESVLAIIAIITAAYLTREQFSTLLLNGGPIHLFSEGVGEFMSHVGIPKETGKSFVSLAVSAFALTSLDTATRLARLIFQEYFENPKEETQNILANKYVATVFTVMFSFALAVKGYAIVWPIFGSANQLMASLALLTLAVWLKNKNRNYKMFLFPMVFMFVSTLSALAIIMKNNFVAENRNFFMVAIPAFLFVMALVLAKEGADVLIKNKTVDSETKKLM